MSLRIYKKNDIYYLNSVIVPVNQYRCLIETIGANDYISIDEILQKTKVINRIPVTAIQKEVGYYADTNEFITDVGKLFCNVTTGGSTEATLLDIKQELIDIKTNQTNDLQSTKIVDVHGHEANVQLISNEIQGDEYGLVTNTVIHGKSNTLPSKWIDTKVNNYGNLMVGIDPIQLDSFGRLRTGHPSFRFDAQLTYQINSDTWDIKTVNGTVTHDATNRMALLTATATANSSAVLQSHYNPPYTPGRGHLALITFNFLSAPTAGGIKRVGLYDDVNGYGIYLEQNATETKLVLKSGTSNPLESVLKNDWNIDKMDGTGVSGITLDLTKTQILIITYQALYVGRVIVGFDIEGVIVPIHQFTHANQIVYPYIAQASLPVHYSCHTTSFEQTMNAICASVISEGGLDLFNIQGRTFATGNGITSINVTTRRPVLTIRAKQTLNSINQQALCIPIDVEILASGSNAYIEIVRNGTLTGTPTFTDVDTPLSVIERDVSYTGISGGTIVAAMYAVSGAGTTKISNEDSIAGKILINYSHLLGVADTLSIVATSFTGTAAINSLIKWKEIR